MGQTGFSKAASWIAFTAVAVTFRLVPKLSGMHSGQDALDRASTIYIGLTCLIVQPEVVICQAGDPAMAGCIQLGCGQYISEWVVVSIYIEG